MSKPRKLFTSQNYPQDYENNQLIFYHINLYSTKAKYIYLEFTDFFTEAMHDKVYVYDTYVDQIPEDSESAVEE